MATSSEIVNAAYLNLYRAPPTAEAAGVIQNGLSFSDNPAGSYPPSAIRSFVQDATATTAVAVLSYGFFIGVTLGREGLDYLLSPTGPNPNNLNSAYYAGFSAENRYINFAKNLGAVGEGSAAFAAGYGGLSLAQTVAKAYGAIFGVTITAEYAASASLLGAVVSDGRGGTFTRADYFAFYGGDGLSGQGTKAAAVGWLLSETSRPLGQSSPLLAAARAYMTDLAVDGQAQFGANLLNTYGAGGAYAIEGPYAVVGPSDAGLPGRTFTIAADNEVFVSSGTKLQMISPYGKDYSTYGNDIVTSTTGLSSSDPAYLIGHSPRFPGVDLGDGNDVLTVTGGFATARIDLGSGNDVARFSAFNGRLITGPGYDRVFIDTFSSQGSDRSGALFTPEIYDLKRGFDVVTLGAASGAGRIAAADVRASATLDVALATVAAATPAGTNTVFEYAGSTYVFHQNADPAVNIGPSASADGLIKLTGLTGAAVGVAGGPGDILFGG